MTTKCTMNRWLSDCSLQSLGWRFWFDYGADHLGSDWRSKIPITGLLLAGIHAKKILVSAEYDPYLLVGGIKIIFEKVGLIETSDFDDLAITRNQFEKIYDA